MAEAGRTSAVVARAEVRVASMVRREVGSALVAERAVFTLPAGDGTKAVAGVAARRRKRTDFIMVAVCSVARSNC